MKKAISLLTCVIFFGITEKTYAQNNLQFNQAFYKQLSATAQGIGGDTASFTITVPASQVWKIESANSYNNLNNCNCSYSTQLLLNNAPMSSLPIWLPTGTYSLTLGVWIANTGYSGTAVSNISGIEFNIVP